ncbi:MAG: phosphatidate cytidylyltransferase [Planctomycetota bacterium]
MLNHFAVGTPLLLGQSLMDDWTVLLVLITILVLVGLLVVGQILKRQPETNFDPAIIRTFNKRVVAALTMCVVLVVALLASNKVITVVLFGLVSFWALREFITMTPTRRGDHRTLFWVFFLFTPMQYVFVAMIPDNYLTLTRMNAFTLFTLVIPVYAMLFIPARIAFTSDHKRFLERSAKIQFGLLICVYALSHAPALLYLDLKSYNVSASDVQQGIEALDTTAATNGLQEWNGSPAGLLFFLLVIVQVSDMLQFVWDRVAGQRVIAATVHPTKTWEGLIGAACSTTIVGILIQLLMPVTPFTWHGAGLMALLISIMASSGGMTMSAIKRDRKVKDYGTLVQGHAGVLDRIDSICFAAPIFFHVTRLFLER